MERIWAWLKTRRCGQAVFLAVAAGIVAYTATEYKPMLAGDAFEYCATLQAFEDHLTPDVREADLDRLGPLYDWNRVCKADCARLTATATAVDGKRYTHHFWAYSLTVLPMKMLLRLVHARWELDAFHLTNLILMLVALYAVLFGLPWPLGRRFWFAGLIVLTPVLWYLRWPSTEVFSWSCVVVSIVFFERRALPAAALVAGLGALQNPPVLFLALYAVLLALEPPRAFRRVAVTALCASVSLLPNAFYLWKFHRPSLMAIVGGFDDRLVSVHRVWSFVGDLNQGMLPYVPGLVLLGTTSAVLAIASGIQRRRWQEPALVAAMLVMIASCGVTPNWNAGEATIQRYTIWMMPLFAWLIVLHTPPRTRNLAWGFVVAIQMVIALAGSSKMFFLEHTRLARSVLTHAPSLYDPEPDIFAERLLHDEIPFDDKLPLAFVVPNGNQVTKLLADAKSLDRLPERFRVDPAWLASIRRQYARRRSRFYLEPPKGAVLLPAVPP